jgi:hypothetical protein
MEARVAGMGALDGTYVAGEARYAGTQKIDMFYRTQPFPGYVYCNRAANSYGVGQFISATEKYERPLEQCSGTGDVVTCKNGRVTVTRPCAAVAPFATLPDCKQFETVPDGKVCAVKCFGGTSGTATCTNGAFVYTPKCVPNADQQYIRLSSPDVSGTFELVRGEVRWTSGTAEIVPSATEPATLYVNDKGARKYMVVIGDTSPPRLVLYDLKGDTVYGASVAFVPYVEPAATDPPKLVCDAAAGNRVWLRGCDVNADDCFYSCADGYALRSGKAEASASCSGGVVRTLDECVRAPPVPTGTSVPAGSVPAGSKQPCASCFDASCAKATAACAAGVVSAVLAVDGARVALRSVGTTGLLVGTSGEAVYIVKPSSAETAKVLTPSAVLDATLVAGVWSVVPAATCAALRACLSGLTGSSGLTSSSGLSSCAVQARACATAELAASAPLTYKDKTVAMYALGDARVGVDDKTVFVISKEKKMLVATADASSVVDVEFDNATWHLVDDAPNWVVVGIMLGIVAVFGLLVLFLVLK